MNHLKTIEKSISDVKRYIANNSDSAYLNVADRYFPIGPKSLKDHKLDWDQVNQALIEDLYQLTIGDIDGKNLREKIKASFDSSRDTRELVGLIDELYLSSKAINSITPLAYLVSNQETPSKRTSTMINVIQGLITSPLNSKPQLEGNNPLESLLIEKMHELCQLKSFKSKSKRNTYLPFLGDVFTADLKTLAETPSYFLHELDSFLSLYTFLYLTQLTIHLCVPGNRYKTPSAKPLYFILETERASRERHECNQYGYDYLFSKTRGLALGIFPNLGYFSRISELPSWEVILNEDEDFICKIDEFNNQLASLFGEVYQHDSSLQGALNNGAALQKQIFENTSRKDANKKVVDIFEKIFSAGFISDRKTAGKYFVLNSNTLLLLTNLVIGGAEDNQLLIDDVIEGFKQRGICLDIKSKKALLKFYENVGNIEKLSDSGDAVYVKTTI
ncbi:MAG: DNA phosphorothioation-dependent restriction protein DptG [Oleispira sp.]|nr:DNA phosphorothioation-dependent restriction protein DptG [Oleispira sp.]